MKIRVEKTTASCPTQYEGVTDDGRNVYIRYRHGNFSVELFVGEYLLAETTLLLNVNHGSGSELEDSELIYILKSHGIECEICEGDHH